jgi:hypothetical protein
LEIDHLVGRVHNVPIHHGLVVKACGPCNRRQWGFWHHAGIASSDPTPAEQLRRVATFFARRQNELDLELADFLAHTAKEMEKAA